MRRYWVQYYAGRQNGPMSYWVHQEQDGRPWHQAEVFAPPLPRPVPGRGYAVLFVEIDRAILWFASPAEMRTCVETLSQKALPSSKVLSAKRGGAYGPSRHWLNRLPLKTMTWPYRQRVVKYLAPILAEYEALVERPVGKGREGSDV